MYQNYPKEYLKYFSGDKRYMESSIKIPSLINVILYFPLKFRHFVEPKQEKKNYLQSNILFFFKNFPFFKRIVQHSKIRVISHRGNFREG